MRLRYLGGSLAALAMGAVASANLIVNGDFSSGNAVGFTSDYTYVSVPTNVGGPSGGMWDEGTYAIAGGSTSGVPKDWHNLWSSTDLSAGGHDEYMMVNGSTDGTKSVWSAAPPLVLAAGTYVFSADISTVYGGETSGTAAQLALMLGSLQVGTIDSPTSVGWVNKSFTFTLGSTTSGGNFLDLVTLASGNDFALDNLTLEAVPEPFTMVLGASALGLAIVRRRKAART